MSSDWRKFVAIKVPVCVIAVVLAIESLAALLAHAPLDRHPLDRLVNGLPRVAATTDVALTGDSVTRELAKYYALDEDQRVLNLTTNKASAVAGVLLLWRRLADSVGTPPNHLLMAITPEFLAYVPDPATYETYVWSVFSRKDERATLLDLGYPDAGEAAFPAIRSLQSSIYDRLMGWLFASGAPPRFGPTVPRHDLRTEGPGVDAASADELASRNGFEPVFSETAARTLSALCKELSADDAALTIAWAPTPQSVRQAWRERSVLERYQAEIAELDGCGGTSFMDINGLHEFPDHAFRDSHHLRWPGWINAYGLLLRDLLADFE